MTQGSFCLTAVDGSRAWVMCTGAALCPHAMDHDCCGSFAPLPPPARPLRRVGQCLLRAPPGRLLLGGCKVHERGPVPIWANGLWQCPCLPHERCWLELTPGVLMGDGFHGGWPPSLGGFVGKGALSSPRGGAGMSHNIPPVLENLYSSLTLH